MKPNPREGSRPQKHPAVARDPHAADKPRPSTPFEALRARTEVEALRAELAEQKRLNAELLEQLTQPAPEVVPPQPTERPVPAPLPVADLGTAPERPNTQDPER